MMNRRILIIWCIISVLLTAGCGKYSGSGFDRVEKRALIRYENWEVYPAQLKLHQQVVDAFNHSQNEVYVKLEPAQGGPNKIKVEIAGGTAPDVFYWCDTILPPLVQKNSVADLSPFIKKEGVDLGQYFPALLDGLRYNGGIYGLPIYYGTNALVYNKDIFDAAHLPYPDSKWTWNDFRATARKLTVRKEGKPAQYGALLPGSMDVVESLGGKLFDPEGKHCLADSREMREGLRYLLTLQNVDKSVPSLAQLGGEVDKLKNGLQMFMTGRIGMFIAPSFMLSSLQDIKAFSWDVA
ncbi:MAG: extracellular solute-binding protein, partial [bacterium]